MSSQSRDWLDLQIELTSLIIVETAYFDYEKRQNFIFENGSYENLALNKPPSKYCPRFNDLKEYNEI